MRLICVLVVGGLLSLTACESQPAPTVAPTPILAPSVFATGPSAAGGYQTVLEALGQAYAQDSHLDFKSVEFNLAGTVQNDGAQWNGQLQHALAVGYVPGDGTFTALAFDDLQDVMSLEMAGQKSPADTVRSVIVPGHAILRVTWHFAGGDPVTSYTVFSADKELLFDTLISMPVIDLPIFSPNHL